MVLSAGSYIINKKSLTDLSRESLLSNGLKMKKSISDYSKDLVEYTNVLASDRLTEGLFLAYESAFYGSGFNPGLDLRIDNEEYYKLHNQYSERVLKLLEIYRL